MQLATSVCSFFHLCVVTFLNLTCNQRLLPRTWIMAYNDPTCKRVEDFYPSTWNFLLLFPKVLPHQKKRYRYMHVVVEATKRFFLFFFPFVLRQRNQFWYLTYWWQTFGKRPLAIMLKRKGKRCTFLLLKKLTDWKNNNPFFLF